jgi:hypothetical protein
VVQELSKFMDKATPEAFKEMKCVMRFLSSMKDYGLCIKPHQPGNDKFKWNMIIYTDSDQAGNKEDR